jgi:acyl carrier protein
MTRDEIITQILQFFRKEFEIENPGLDENLLGSELTQEEKKRAMDIRTINQICDYIESLAKVRPALSK